MAKSSTKAKYFCENCGSEVAANARCCPRCGKFFSSVRCPACGHMGTVHDFKYGCPVCHYAMTEEDINGTSVGAEKSDRDVRSKKKKSKAKKTAGHEFSSGKILGDDVPAWLFVVSVIVLIGILALVFYRCQ
ncbi:MAG: zinc ribbon domain-containing protein [Treponema sp.]|nr:zinc ribbon domain-containing protein [Treponema sp.]